MRDWIIFTNTEFGQSKAIFGNGVDFRNEGYIYTSWL